MTKKYLDETGLSKLVSKMKNTFSKADHVHDYAASDTSGGSANEAKCLVAVTTTAGEDANTYNVSLPNISELKNGLSFVIIPHVNSSSTGLYLRVNNGSRYQLRPRLSSGTPGYFQNSTSLRAGLPVKVTYMETGTYRYFLVDTTIPVASEIYGTVPIQKGGTGATSASAALKSLGAAPSWKQIASTTHYPLSSSNCFGTFYIKIWEMDDALLDIFMIEVMAFGTPGIDGDDIYIADINSISLNIKPYDNINDGTILDYGMGGQGIGCGVRYKKEDDGTFVGHPVVIVTKKISE